MLIDVIRGIQKSLRQHQVILQPMRCTIHTTSLYEAARKGTREKARKKKVKVEVQKVGFIPHNQREKKQLLNRVDKHRDDSWKKIAQDDCYIVKFFRRPIYTIQEAIKCHRETHHPSMYNVPNAPVLVDIELNMRAEKATRFVDNFQRMALVPHKFDHGETRQILVFSKNEEDEKIAHDAGATLFGGTALIKDISNGEIALSDYQYVVAHTNILPELVTLRGLMKRKFPNPKTETLGTNLLDMIRRYSEGIRYAATKDEYQQAYALISTSIGTLDMDSIKLEENLSSLLNDINLVRPKRDGRFITRVYIKSPPSGECLRINPFAYIPELYEKPDNTKFDKLPSDEIISEKTTESFPKKDMVVN